MPFCLAKSTPPTHTNRQEFQERIFFYQTIRIGIAFFFFFIIIYCRIIIMYTERVGVYNTRIIQARVPPSDKRYK